MQISHYLEVASHLSYCDSNKYSSARLQVIVWYVVILRNYMSIWYAQKIFRVFQKLLSHSAFLFFWKFLNFSNVYFRHESRMWRYLLDLMSILPFRWALTEPVSDIMTSIMILTANPGRPTAIIAFQLSIVIQCPQWYQFCTKIHSKSISSATVDSNCQRRQQSQNC